MCHDRLTDAHKDLTKVALTRFISRLATVALPKCYSARHLSNASVRSRHNERIIALVPSFNVRQLEQRMLRRMTDIVSAMAVVLSEFCRLLLSVESGSHGVLVVNGKVDRFSTRPVLKHGPRSLMCTRV